MRLLLVFAAAAAVSACSGDVIGTAVPATTTLSPPPGPFSDKVTVTLTSDKPTIMPYPEEVWAELSDAKTAPVEASLEILDGLHGRWVMLLRSRKAADFDRTFVHPEHGERSLDWMIAMYAWHCHHHAAHITELRKAKGW